MDHSRSPRRYHNAGGQVSYYPPLSDEARLLQRLAESELPPGATDAERAAARAEAAAGVEHAANELGGHWAEAYQELHPDWQPTRTEIEVSHERSAELTAARAESARLQAENARLLALSRNNIKEIEPDLWHVYSTLNDFNLSAGEARRRVLLYLHGMSTQYGWGWVAPPQPLQAETSPPGSSMSPQPFTGQGNRLGE